jgi:hypothetical protein
LRLVKLCERCFDPECLAALNLCCHAPTAIRGFAAAELLWSADCTAPCVAPRSAADAGAPPPKPLLRAARLACEAAVPLPAMDEAPAPASMQARRNVFALLCC